LSELLENSVGLPACCNLKGHNTPSQNTCLFATLPRYALEPPFSVSNAGQPNSFSIEACISQLGDLPVKYFH